jgi:hypothetical protein
VRSILAGIGVALAMAAAGPATAQAPDPAAHRVGMDSLAFMIGEWHGEGWMVQGPGKRELVTLRETVTRKLGGVVFEVEGIGTVPGTGAAGGRTVHHALGVISYEPTTRAYTLRAYLATGQYADFSLTPIAGGVRWEREVPGGRIRNTARFDADTWYEVGEFSRDGASWTQVMDMNLRRVP